MIVPPRYDGAFYAITSGIALAVVAILLQPAGQPVFVLDGLPRVAVSTAALLAVAGFAWGVHALRTFDQYRAQVPILIPWRGRVAVQIKTTAAQHPTP